MTLLRLRAVPRFVTGNPRSSTECVRTCDSVLRREGAVILRSPRPFSVVRLQRSRDSVRRGRGAATIAAALHKRLQPAAAGIMRPRGSAPNVRRQKAIHRGVRGCIWHSARCSHGTDISSRAVYHPWPTTPVVMGVLHCLCTMLRPGRAARRASWFAVTRSLFSKPREPVGADRHWPRRCGDDNCDG